MTRLWKKTPAATRQVAAAEPTVRSTATNEDEPS